MTARHLFVAGALGAALLSVPAAAAERPSAAGALAAATAGALPGEAYAQYRRGGYYGGRGYYGRRRGVSGGAVAAGVIGGLAAGALIGGLAAQAAPAPVYGAPAYGAPAYGYGPAPVGNVYGRDPNLVEYCARRYRSYDPASGTFLASDGFRYPCS